MLAWCAAAIVIGSGVGCQGRDTLPYFRPDSAQLVLQQADTMPEIAGWLILKAALLTPDSTERAKLYARVNIPAARERIPAVEAQAYRRYHHIPEPPPPPPPPKPPTPEEQLAIARTTGDPSRIAAAEYQYARALLGAGKVAAAQTQLRRITTALPRDTSAAAALVLLADLASDDQDDVTARRLWRQVGDRFAHTRFAVPAKFQSALASFVLQQYSASAREFSALESTSERLAATYWLGRARERLGSTATARRAWRSVLAQDSTSYYAVLAASRLNERNVHDMTDTGTYPHVPAVDSAWRRATLLRSIGMDTDSRYEIEWLVRTAPSDRARLLATAATLVGTDQSGRAIALGRRALVDYGASPMVYRLVYPIAVRDTIMMSARANKIDPVLIAALIRQESNFNPRAISPVGARGLMQLMPEVARSIAPSVGVSSWSSDMLFRPGLNIMLGVAHLAPLIHRQPDLARALAAYNAGESRVTRWARKRGADDPELFTERIPFVETREYVKSIVRNRAMYRALYHWE